MVLLLTKAQRKPFKAATVGALSMSLMGTPFAVPASFAVESPAPQQITAAQAQQVQGIPGQYQIRHSKAVSYTHLRDRARIPRSANRLPAC